MFVNNMATFLKIRKFTFRKKLKKQSSQNDRGGVVEILMETKQRIYFYSFKIVNRKILSPNPSKHSLWN